MLMVGMPFGLGWSFKGETHWLGQMAHSSCIMARLILGHQLSAGLQVSCLTVSLCQNVEQPQILAGGSI